MHTTDLSTQITPVLSRTVKKAFKKPAKRFQKARATLVMLAISAATLLYASSSVWMLNQQNATTTQNSFSSTVQPSNSFSSSQTVPASATDQSSNGFSSVKNGG